MFDAPVPFFCASVAGLGSGESFLEGLEQVALISVDLQEVFFAFFYDGAGGFMLVVQRVGGDDFSVEQRQFFE